MKSQPDSNNQYDDSNKGGYSYEEKLRLVAQELLDPKEIGLPGDTKKEQAESVAKAKAQLAEENPPFVGDFITCQIGEVPIAARAHWARQQLKIQPANPQTWEADWIENCKDHLIRGIIKSGNQQANMQQLVKEPMSGMIDFLREAANFIEKKYKEQNARDIPSTPVVNA